MVHGGIDLMGVRRVAARRPGRELSDRRLRALLERGAGAETANATSSSSSSASRARAAAQWGGVGLGGESPAAVLA